MESRKSWSDVLQGQDGKALEREALPAFLPRQRWFAGKSRSILSVEIQDWLTAPDGADWALSILRVRYTEGDHETYLLPLARASGAEAGKIRVDFPRAVITEAHASGSSDGWPGGGPELLYEGIHSSAFRAGMLNLMFSREIRHWRDGSLVAIVSRQPLENFPETSMNSFVLDAEHSHSAFIYGDRFFLKLLRKVEEGMSPESEMLRFLCDETGFRNAPPFFASLEYFPAFSGAGQDTGSEVEESWSLAILEGLVAHEEGAWTFAVKAANRHIENLRQIPSQSTTETLSEGDWEFSRLLGRRTAEMHMALASRPFNRAFGAHYFSVLDRWQAAATMRGLTEKVFAQLSGALPKLPEFSRELAGEVLRDRSRIMDTIDSFESDSFKAIQMRIHGDYHLGQVLCASGDVVILDFEGEPARPLRERKEMQSPWRDVAGMLRSFHYALHVAGMEAATPNTSGASRPDVSAQFWPEAMSGVFLRTYLETWDVSVPMLYELASFPPPRETEWKPLLKVFLLEKAIYELGYELNNRPDWAHIPLLGISGLLQDV